MANNLETYQGGCSAADQTSDIHVLRYLQRRFAPLDDVDEQVEATKNLEGMTRGDNERIDNFNSRFNAQVQYVRSCGIPVLPRDQLPQYLRTLRRCDAPDIHYKVRRYAERIEMGESFTLTDVQDGLQQCDDEAQRGKRAQETSTGRNRQATQHASSASNVSTESGPSSNTTPSRPIECWSCGLNHHLRACPTTSAADRKTLFDTHRNTSRNSRGQSGSAGSASGSGSSSGSGNGTISSSSTLTAATSSTPPASTATDQYKDYVCQCS